MFSASVGAFLMLFTPLVGAGVGGGFKSARANQAADRFAHSVQQAAEDFDKRVRGAREAYIRELKLAESAASRTGDDADAGRIQNRLTMLTRAQELPSQLPKPLAPPSLALPDTQFLLSSGRTWVFQKNGVVLSVQKGKKTGEGNWKQLGSNSATVRLSSFYAVAFDPEYKQCIIRGEGSEYRGKRVK